MLQTSIGTSLACFLYSQDHAINLGGQLIFRNYLKHEGLGDKAPPKTCGIQADGKNKLLIHSECRQPDEDLPYPYRRALYGTHHRKAYLNITVFLTTKADRENAETSLGAF